MVVDIDVQELERWQKGGKKFILLDVRDDQEFAEASVPGSLHIPAHDLPDRLSGLSHDAEIVVMCHLGGRSARAAHFLQLQGFRYVFNLMGGIDAYALQIDPGIARY